MATAAQEGRFHLRGGFPSLSTRRCKAIRSPFITHSSASAASAICTMHGNGDKDHHITKSFAAHDELGDMHLPLLLSPSGPCMVIVTTV